MSKGAGCPCVIGFTLRLFRLLEAVRPLVLQGLLGAADQVVLGLLVDVYEVGREARDADHQV